MAYFSPPEKSLKDAVIMGRAAEVRALLADGVSVAVNKEYVTDLFFERGGQRIKNWGPHRDRMGIKWDSRDGPYGHQPTASRCDLYRQRRLKEPSACFQPSFAWMQGLLRPRC